jgi:DivIVA domain-containing protein
VDPAQIENRTFPIVRRGYDRDEVDAFVRTMAREHRQLVERTRQALEAARQAAARQAAAEQAAAEQRTAAPAPDQLFGELGTRVTAVLSSATEVAEGIKAAAIEEAEAIRQQAYEDTDEMRREVADKLAEADRLVAEAEQEAERVLATARTEGARVVTGARDRAEQISHDAEERAAALERTVRANVEAILAEARREYEHLRTAQQQCIDRLASVEFLAKHARDGLSDAFTSTFDERLEATR